MQTVVVLQQQDYSAANQPQGFARERIVFRLAGEHVPGIPLSDVSDPVTIARLEGREQPLSTTTRAKESIRIQVRIVDPDQ